MKNLRNSLITILIVISASTAIGQESNLKETYNIHVHWADAAYSIISYELTLFNDSNISQLSKDVFGDFYKDLHEIYSGMSFLDRKIMYQTGVSELEVNLEKSKYSAYVNEHIQVGLTKVSEKLKKVNDNEEFWKVLENHGNISNSGNDPSEIESFILVITEILDTYPGFEKIGSEIFAE